MIIKILGIFDLIGSVFLFILGWGFALPQFILTFFAIVFGIKSLFIITKDIASFFDLFACIMFVLSIFFTLPSGLLLVAGFLILQKGFFSMLG